MNPSLDLNFDSFAWMELTVVLQERLGVHLAEDDLRALSNSAPCCGWPSNGAPAERLPRWIAADRHRL